MSPRGRFPGERSRPSVKGVIASELVLIAAAGHEPPPGAHLAVMAVIVVAVAIGLVVMLRRGRTGKDHPDEPPTRVPDSVRTGVADRERSER